MVSITDSEPKAQHRAEVVSFYGDEFVSEKLKSELILWFCMDL